MTLTGTTPIRTLDAIGLLEVSSVALGYLAEDAMLKAAAVEIILARSICSGKFLVVVAGDVASVQAAVAAGEVVTSDGLIEAEVISRIHASVFPAIAQAVDLDPAQEGALGIVETFSAAGAVRVADAAAKAANVVLFRIHLAMALGGKGFVMLTGDVASVSAAVEAGSRVAAEDGILVSRVVIPAPRRELFEERL
jgi:microcompartment protein CcmL/EutN